MDTVWPTVEEAIKEYSTYKQVVKTNGEADQTWERLINTTIKSDYISGWRQYSSSTGLYRYKVYCVFNQVNLEEFFKFYTDYRYREKWDPYTSKLEIITPEDEQWPTDQILMKWRVKFGLPLISDREYLFTRQIEKVDGVYVIFDKNYTSDAIPETKKVVRVGSYNSYFILEQDGDNTIMFNSYVTPLDLKMPIPTWLVNWAASSGVKNVVTSFRESFQKYPDYLAKLDKN